MMSSSLPTFTLLLASPALSLHCPHPLLRSSGGDRRPLFLLGPYHPCESLISRSSAPFAFGSGATSYAIPSAPHWPPACPPQCLSSGLLAGGLPFRVSLLLHLLPISFSSGAPSLGFPSEISGLCRHSPVGGLSPLPFPLRLPGSRTFQVPVELWLLVEAILCLHFWF
jgi:hypothetical protein